MNGRSCDHELYALYLRIQGMYGSVIPIILNVAPFESVHHLYAVHLPLCIQYGVHHFFPFP